ncbi:hypothetical protein D1610_12705 [Sphingomonas gilva]|uniref:Uncharacterized protein n=1 Tax=Sphingomonas gilva TaxID=2305907 RepID=A0A396RLE7_9SPHN|nr:hypothetical protein [Sphingomonas gilva]RHW16989.1 hypothetical protein D1610_12705 [Sphingomonas gilva]
MKISAAKASILAIAVTLGAAALGVPAIGQNRDQDAPESLLPEGFGDPVEQTPTPTPQPVPGQPTPLLPPTTGAPLPAPDEEEEEEQSEEEAAAAAQALAEALRKAELPASSRRSTARVGVVGPDGQGIEADAYGRTRGAFLSALMRRIDAPIASRWLSIALRRALMSRTDTPSGVNGADFAAERAWLLLRMGEAKPAQAIVQAVDTDRYTPKLFQVAMQAALAKGDPAALCPLADPASEVSEEPSWLLAKAMCAGLTSDPGTAGQFIDQARRQRLATGIDLLLAEKVTGAGANGRRAVTIEWDDVDQLTAWRYGLATATNVAIPAALFETVGRHVQAWRAQAPMLDAAARVPVAAAAAVMGVLSNIAYVDLVAAAEQSEDVTPEESALASDLRDAYVGSAEDRMTALRALWNGVETPEARHARSILTARAAARIPASETYSADASALIAAMLSAGLDIQAMDWAEFVASDSDGWAMLAVADPDAEGQVGYGDFDNYADNDPRKGALLLAGLTGLGRFDFDDAGRASAALQAGLGAQNSWTREIMAAAERGEQGTVLVLAAVGMQTRDWRGVSPLALFHIVSALRRVGLEGEARMIAAEAIARG